MPRLKPVTWAAPLVVLLSCAIPDPFADSDPESPTLFAPGVVSTEAREYGITFSPDLTEIYFARRPRRGRPQLFVSRFAEGAWTEPELAPFSRPGDESPYMSADGSRLLFSSRRPLPTSGDDGNNLWEVRRTETGWSEPLPLPGVVNRPDREIEEYDTGREIGPVMLEGGGLLFSSSTDPDWRSDLYLAEPAAGEAFGTPRPLRINSPGDESSPALSPDGRLLVFQGYRDADGVGGQDLYLSRRTEYGWSDPVVLPRPLNSPFTDGWPAFTPDGRYFFFASDRDGRGGMYSIYYVRASALEESGS